MGGHCILTLVWGKLVNILFGKREVGFKLFNKREVRFKCITIMGKERV